MAEAVMARSPAVGQDRSYLLRRLHSLTGIVPVGAYMAFHLFENLKATKSPEAFETMVKGIWGLAPRPVFYLIEICAIFVPLLFHALYGFYIARTGQANPGAYGFRRNWMYSLQRWSGYIAFAYLTYHVWTLRIAPGVLRSDEHLTKWLEVRDAIVPGLGTAIYLIGNIACAFHLGNGIWGFCYAWGLAVGRGAQRMVEYAGWAVTVALSSASVYIILSLHLMKP